jgi:hypothetical protein
MNTAKLPTEFKSKWIAALRSGEYKQATGELYDEINGGFCCIGVAGHICGIPTEELKLLGVFEYGNKLSLNVPNEIVGEGVENKIVGILTDMNDNDKKSFAEIADYIEANL